MKKKLQVKSLPRIFFEVQKGIKKGFLIRLIDQGFTLTCRGNCSEFCILASNRATHILFNSYTLINIPINLTAVHPFKCYSVRSLIKLKKLE